MLTMVITLVAAGFCGGYSGRILGKKARKYIQKEVTEIHVIKKASDMNEIN